MQKNLPRSSLMSSRNKKNLLQLSVATLFLFQFFVMFSPNVASGFLNSIRFETVPHTKIRYELKITAVKGRVLGEPIFISQSWNDLGIEEYGEAQILIDDLARSLSQGKIEKAQAIYVDLEKHHIHNIENFDFELQRVRVTKAPIKSNAYNSNNSVEEVWSSTLLELE